MSKMLKKLAVLSMSVMLGVATLSGCGEKSDVQTIGIVQIVEHPSLDEVREHAIAELASKGFVDGENIKIDYQNAQGDQSNLNTICNKFVGDEVDVIIAIATPSAQAAQAASKDIPIVFSAVTDPVAAKLVVDPTKPEANLTGVSDRIPIETVFELMNELTPDIKSLGFLYTASEVNSQVAIEQAKEIATAKGITFEEMTITNTSELKQVAESLAGKVDAIYTPTDNGISSAMPVLGEVGREAKIPVYVGADSMVQGGGYATNGVDYKLIGKETGDMVARLLSGTSIQEMPVVYLETFNKVINKTTADIIGAPNFIEGAIVVE